MAKNPGKHKRKSRQRLKERYAKKREDAQLAGIIPTVPEGAVRSEVVDPRTQDEQRFPGLDRLVIREEKKGKWHVPEHVARKVVEVSAEVLFERRVGYDKDGREVELPPNRAEQLAAARVLQAADNAQHERDHPQGRGGATVNVGVQVNTGAEIAELMRRVEAQKQVGKDLEDGNAATEEPPAVEGVRGVGESGGGGAGQ